jgi:hypothetical protein
VPSALALRVVVVLVGVPKVITPGPDTAVQSTDDTPLSASEALPVCVNRALAVTSGPALTTGEDASTRKLVLPVALGLPATSTAEYRK